MQKLYWILFLCGFLLVSTARAASTGSDGDDVLYPEDEDDIADDYEVPDNVHPIITSNPLKLEVDEGQRVELPCKGEHLQHFALIWQKGDNILAAGEVVVGEDKRVSLADKGGVLIIDKINNKDSGDYTCKTTAEKRFEVAVTHSIRVREAPTAKLPEKTRIVKENEPVTLSCTVTGYPEPVVYWERKGKKMPTGEQRIEGREITFSSVSRHHAGQYECFANNSLGAAVTAVSLVVMHAPEIEIEKESVNSGEGYDAELTCTVHAEPKATVVWYKDGVQMRSENKHESIQKMSHFWILHIKGVTMEDFGNYTCVANNTLGRAHTTILLSGAPSQPVVKESKPKDQMSYTIVWDIESTIPIDSYKIKFRQANGEWAEIDGKGEMTQGNVYTVTYTFGDLSLSTEYEATLFAHNDYGWSREARVRKFQLNGEFQSLEPETEPQAKGATGGSSPLYASLSPLLLAFALFLSFIHLSGHLRWK